MRILRLTAWSAGLLAFVFLCATEGAAAQWLSRPLPGTPRTPDGKPNLKAATPRAADGKPNFSGIWRAESYRWVNNLLPDGVDAPFLPWAAELFKKRQSTLGYDVPMTFCMPHSVPDAMLVYGHPFKIVQTPEVMIHLYEEFHKYRQIHTDGSRCPSIRIRRGMATRSAAGRATPSSPKPRASRKAAGSPTRGTRTPTRSASPNASGG